MNTHDAITLARKHIGNGAVMESSARLCLEDAVTLYDRAVYCTDSDDEAMHEYMARAKERAIRSLAYTVGIGHPDYIEASK